MREFKNILEFTAFAAGLDSVLGEAKREALVTGAKMIKSSARDLIGSPHSFWPPLKPETIAGKALGNTPLYETGAMRDSIEITIVDDEHAEIGSNSDIAVYQELGTATIPARSFLAAGAALVEEDVATATRSIVQEAIEGHHSITRKITHIAVDALKDFAHSVKEDIDDLSEEDKHR